jgi:hypothetical protein
MSELTDSEFTATARTMALGVLRACQEQRLSSDTAAALAGAALTEALGQLLGPVAAIERLRDMADLFEAQCLGEMRH